MAPHTSDVATVASLRAVTYRISNTPTEKLPQVAPQIAAAVWNCRDLLTLPVDSKPNGELAVLVHRFSTQVSALLQDRSVSGRWAGVVISKALIEAGGWEVLSKCSGWIRSLLGILKRPDPPSTRRLAIIVSTRIFVLTWEYSNLVREITTPTLPAFILTCLNNIEIRRCSASELQATLDAFITLVARHTTIFRTNETAIRSLLFRILSTTPSAATPGTHYTKGHRSSACRLLVLLHGCAPKQTAGQKWDETLGAVISTAHTVCDRVFRSVHEEWKSTTDVRPSMPSEKLVDGEVRMDSTDALGLSPWQGIHAGCERLVALLALLGAHLEMPTGSAISVRVGAMVDLLNRILSIRTPHLRQHGQLRANHEVSNEERETLYSILPNVHSAAMGACNAVITRFGNISIAMQNVMLDMFLYIFPSERMHASIREAMYTTSNTIVKLIGHTMTREDVADLDTLLQAACADLLPDQMSKKSNVTLLSASQDLGKAGLSSAGSGNTLPTAAVIADVQTAAVALLRCALERIPAAYFSAKTRAQTDRTAVLVQEKGLLLVSTLNPPVRPSDGRHQPSLLPFLVRGYPDEAQTECLLRPRLPPIRIGERNNEAVGTESWGAGEEGSSPSDPEDSELTSGLLSALTQSGEQLGAPTQSIASQEVESQTNDYSVAPKRPAAYDISSEPWSKRTRASEDAEDPALATLHQLPDLDTPMESSAAQTAGVTGSPETREDRAAQPTGSSFQNTMAAASVILPGNDMSVDDVDSDIGTPPLTMDPDTDQEDEGEDEET